MPFQALAWAWKVETDTPIERLALMWLAKNCDENGCASLDLVAFCNFASCSPAQADVAFDSLEQRRLLVRDPTSDFAMAFLPNATVLVGDEFVPVPNRELVHPALRRQVIEDHGGKCFACGSTDDPHVDHIVPRAKGGTNDPSNLQVLCGPCNMRKGARQGWVR